MKRTDYEFSRKVMMMSKNIALKWSLNIITENQYFRYGDMIALALLNRFRKDNDDK